MYQGLLLILLLLILGYCIPLKSKSLVEAVNKACSRMVYLILFLMGISLGQIENLGSEIQGMLTIALGFFSCISLCNLAGLWLFDRARGSRQHQASLTGQGFSKWHLLLDSANLVGLILAGTLLALFAPLEWLPTALLSEWALYLLLFLIGIQMRNSGMSLRQILLNPWGMKIAGVVVLTSWLGGLLAATLMQLPWQQGLAIASGFGWYSLTGILISDHLGANMGAAAFLNELLRELAAILLIPLLMRRYPSMAVGYGGATAMDFTLPVIQKAGGVTMVPVAIVSGFILSVLCPLLILFFLGL